MSIRRPDGHEFMPTDRDLADHFKAESDDIGRLNERIAELQRQSIGLVTLLRSLVSEATWDHIKASKPGQIAQKMETRIAELERDNADIRNEWKLCAETVTQAMNEVWKARGAAVNEKAAHDRTKKALRLVQWGNYWISGSGEGFSMCPLCDQVDKNGHSPDCLVGAALQGDA